MVLSVLDEDDDEGAEEDDGAAVADANNVLANAALHNRCTYKHTKSASRIRCDNTSLPSILLLSDAAAVVVDDDDVDDDGMVAMVIFGAQALQQKTKTTNRSFVRCVLPARHRTLQGYG